MTRLLVVVWLLQRTLFCVALAAKIMQPNQTNPNNAYIRLNSLLRIAAWNCGGLTHTVRQFCSEEQFDILALTETHDRGTLSSSKNFIVSEPAPDNDSYSGTALLLSDKVSNCVMHKGHCGSRISYARIRSQPCNLFVICIYIPQEQRKLAPFANDTLSQ